MHRGAWNAGEQSSSVLDQHGLFDAVRLGQIREDIPQGNAPAVRLVSRRSSAVLCHVGMLGAENGSVACSIPASFL
jgi:hypothetical protein